jgi:S-adenosylmethionine decarboxylase
MKSPNPVGQAEGDASEEPHPRPAPAIVPVPAAPHAAATLGFGPHLIFDGFGCPAARLSDLGRLYTLLDRLPDQIGMTKIMPPYVFRHGSGKGAEVGLSGFVLIAESHISVHTFPRRRFANVDVFSCEPFDVRIVLAALGDALSPGRAAWKLLDRGSEFPKDIGNSRGAVMAQRRAVARTLGLEVTRR